MLKVLVTGAGGQLGSELRYLTALAALPAYHFEFAGRSGLGWKADENFDTGIVKTIERYLGKYN